MEKKDYLKLINEIKLPQNYRFDGEILEKFLKESPDLALSALQYVKGILTSRDVEVYSSLVENTNFFHELDDNLRLACFRMSSDISYLHCKRELERGCEKYSKEKEPFLSNEGLRDAICNKNELVDYSALQRCSAGRAFVIKEKRGRSDCRYGSIDYRLPVTFLDWLDSDLKNYPSAVRIENKPLLSTIPPDRIVESVTYLSNPVWWKDLRIFRGCKEGSSFELQNVELLKWDGSEAARQRYEEYWEYKVKGLRKLQFHAEKRNNINPEYMSMLMEELKVHENNVCPGRNYVVGKMIHCDTNASIGDEFSTARLYHIDLAVNYYFGNAGVERMRQNLAEGGKVVDATFRTHIFRIEGIEMKWLFPFAFAYFESNIMLKEWCEHQFKGGDFLV